MHNQLSVISNLLNGGELTSMAIFAVWK